MRRFINFIILIGLTAQASFAQTSETPEKTGLDHEVKVNMAYPLFEIVELNYELIIDNDFTVGLAANYWFATDANIEWQIIPHFRFYPLESMRGYGFFVEANGSIMGINDYYYDPVRGQDVKETSTGGGMGIAAGYKFLIKRGFVIELYTGLGRVFGDENVELYPRLGLNMGKRF